MQQSKIAVAASVLIAPCSTSSGSYFMVGKQEGSGHDAWCDPRVTANGFDVPPCLGKREEGW